MQLWFRPCAAAGRAWAARRACAESVSVASRSAGGPDHGAIQAPAAPPRAPPARFSCLNFCKRSCTTWPLLSSRFNQRVSMSGSP